MNIAKHRNLDKKSNLDEFNHIIDELLAHDDVLKLHEFSQHFNTSRLQHSVNVAYYSFLVCKKFGWDFKSAARAGILHDLFLYDWRVEKQPEGAHAYAHPIVALRNALSITQLNEIEQDAIVKHMWPVTLKAPKYKESMVVSFADKYSACLEIAEHVNEKSKQKLGFLRNIVFGEVFSK